MIHIEIWTKGGDVYEIEKVAPSEVQSFVELVKQYGVWIDGGHYKFEGAVYHAENKSFEITVK